MTQALEELATTAKVGESGTWSYVLDTLGLF